MAGDKRKRPVEDPASESPRSANPNGFMAASRAATRVEEGRQRRQREIVTPSEQPGQERGYTFDPEVMATIRQLPSYLQLVVTLMDNIVPSSEEDKLRDKRGNEVFAQSTIMIMVVSFNSLSEVF